MKKILIMVFLILGLACMTFAVDIGSIGLKKVNLSIGGLLFSTQIGYEHEFSRLLYSSSYWGNEYFEMEEVISNATALAFDLGVGFFLISEFEITANLTSFSKDLVGNYSLTVPSRAKWNDFASDEAEANPRLQETIFTFGGNFYPQIAGLVKPYIGVAMASISGRLEMVENVEFNDTTYYTHSIDIRDVKFEKVDISKWGLLFRGGVDAELNKNISCFIEVRYLLGGEIEVEHPAIMEIPWSISNLKSFSQEDQILKLGGIGVVFGLRASFTLT